MLYLKYQEVSTASDEERKLFSQWFDNFTNALREIYDCDELQIKHNAKNLKFTIEMPNREPFDFTQLSDGYSAFLNIVVEILMRSDNGSARPNYLQQGICLIDEIETHLHVELQKRVLPFLTRMFPKIQFIVATHSPFVMTSLENAVVFDLETKERLENPGVYSYESVVESFLNTNMYSDKIKGHFKKYKELYLKDRTPEENKEFVRVKAELELVPPASKELYIAFRALENERKAAKNGTLN
jgi:predicted ATP-binding protein involved in virulence